MLSHLDDHKTEFQSILDHYQKDLQSMRTGRAHAGLVEGVRVEAYGQSLELKAVASLTVPDAKTIQIEPWDKTVVKDVEKALIDANLGMMPNTAGTVIRLVMPPMTEETRKNMVKALHQKGEQAKIGVRNVREKVKSLIQADKKAKTVSEDEERRELEKLDKVVAEWNAKIQSMTDDKEREIMTV
jgi:ribosome recycling factor